MGEGEGGETDGGRRGRNARDSWSGDGIAEYPLLINVVHLGLLLVSMLPIEVYL